MCSKALNPRKRRRFILYGTGAALLVAYLFCLPRDLFKGTNYSTVVNDRNGELLGARIAEDGQWRFPPCETVPGKYAEAVIQFEDRHFRHHPGVNPLALGRALIQNLKSGHVTSGGSTLTMQVIRLSRGKERNLWQKCVEAVWATRLELRCSKAEILALYASHAPFGGNVVGLEAAAWRYFGRPAEELSWGEAATLAVLPNAPANIHPGRNREQLLSKRNRLLKRLLEKGIIDQTTYVLSCGEALPEAPQPLPQYACHLVEWYSLHAKGQRVTTDIELPLQQQVEAVTGRWNAELSRSGIADLAALVIDTRTGHILAYVGNAAPERIRPGSQVDIVRSPRSTGSILKPLLYCALLQEGEILPNTLLPDIPVNINGFSPQNFDKRFNGAVPASEALTRSLNVPAVHTLRRYGVPKFYSILQKAGMTTLTRPASDYGLSLILGGAEGTLYEITKIYASLARACGDSDPSFVLHDQTALWYTFEALKELNRPDEIDWRTLNSVRKVAWKTGTSYGFRDAWAVGVTPGYAVGIWAGNAEGQGVPGLTGARTAGPVLFDIFNLLPAEGWFDEPPYGTYITAEVCRSSGHLKGLYCDSFDSMMLPPESLKSAPCPYHRMIEGESRFLLPPSMEWYYKQNHPDYKPLAISQGSNDTPMEFIYPEAGSQIWLPRQLDGTLKGAVFRLAHRNPAATVYWHIDNEYIGETRDIHSMTLAPAPGPHRLTVVDISGNTLSIGFSIGG